MLMPKMGESIMEGTVLKWLKQVGDTIEQDESVLEVATDKVDTEVPAIQGGILREILAQEGQVVAIGHAIAIIDTESGGGNGNQVMAQSEAASPQLQAPVQQPEPSPIPAPAPLPEPEPVKAGSPFGRFYSPLVMNIARELSRRLRVADGILAQFFVAMHEQYAKGLAGR